MGHRVGDASQKPWQQLQIETIVVIKPFSFSGETPPSSCLGLTETPNEMCLKLISPNACWDTSAQAALGCSIDIFMRE